MCLTDKEIVSVFVKGFGERQKGISKVGNQLSYVS
jgi:hypothetical protein